MRKKSVWWDGYLCYLRLMSSGSCFSDLRFIVNILSLGL